MVLMKSDITINATGNKVWKAFNEAINYFDEAINYFDPVLPTCTLFI